MDSFDWAWAFANITRDQKEHVDEVKSVIGALKPWLNLPLYQQEVKAKRTNNNDTLTSTSFVDDLRKRGVSEDVLKKMNQQSDMDDNNDDVDPPPRTM